MIEGQNFYKQWMNFWGFGNKTFGLFKNSGNTRVKIHTIHGPENSSAYSTDGPIKTLVDAYFQQNPQEKTSDHYLVITASNKKYDQGEKEDHPIPYYGIGRWCYAVDYPGLKYENLGTPGPVGDKATIYIGGLYHELGHGINLPHNGPSASQINNPQFGMTLMGSGNYTYGKSPTFLSFYDAATLNNCQVFSTAVKSFYGPVTNTIKTIQAKVENGEIVVSGTYASTVAADHITFRNILESDPDGYQSITFTTVTGPNNSFNVRMPISDFNVKANMAYTLQLFFHHQNGTSTTVNYAYQFVNGQPAVDFSDRNFLIRADWAVAGVSSEQGGYPAVHVLDNNYNTYWHTSWSNPLPHPHFITVKTGANSVTASGLSIATRHDNSGSAGKIKDFKVEVSSNGSTWTEVYHGKMALNGIQYFTFDTPQTFQYVKLISLNDHEGKTFATLAELNLY
ncbi:discoidin domain-containing protein [Sphingobacterium athyrii]|nr:discoidin domain-containing protein [Sphingobacterium athyrii]